MTFLVAEEHAHIQRLVSVVKLAIVLVVCTTEEHRFVVCSLLTKGLNAKNIHKKKCSSRKAFHS
jgi:hypothetical protein